ncbi:disulfide bond formation protein B [Paracoccus sp. 1_MG-2023]|uniref:disulfide bond formation protein B n=1 Tax=unclassified Paracoccus (in: a-proteobacteria) TaxID=2688777 RepID=UPI001C08099C|nr:disulfide bond formation protein B [Paracoccus sp. 1_MG-2023]MBU2958847.1 disulfide bond formation protein B [Paracoccus sp. C2R09]MDO6670022.1 disulfide bond formation protein B [Paracoccus sp. 1_MG-2023]
MTGYRLSLFAAAGSAFLLIAALTFQAAGYAPCELCILQRWPHLAAIVIGGLVWLTGRVRALAILGMIAAGAAMGFAIFHVGVEMQLWDGPQHCSGGVGDFARMSTQDLMARLQDAPVTRCDEVAWSMFGVSMAGWNAVFSAGLAAIWAMAAVRAGRGR